MKTPEKNSRRRFLKNSAAVVAGFSIVPRQVLGRGFLAPSDQLTKGIIGVGGMGVGHIPYAGTRVVAICDVDKKHLQSAAALVGGNVKTFHDHRELIALPEVLCILLRLLIGMVLWPLKLPRQARIFGVKNQ